jgi:metal-responsive CopG/Arc/MetJ family transcriptional regulator
MRTRITVSLPGALVRRVDAVAKRLRLGSRSSAVESALELLVRRARDSEIDASLDAYYGKMTAADRAEEERMVRAFNRSQRKHDLDDERR